MEIKILGARQGESSTGHFASFLIDGCLALDAGNLTAALDLEQQAGIRFVVLTHRHLDHIKDLATLGFNLMGRRQVRVCCTNDVRNAVQRTILNPRIWIDFFSRPTPETPTFVHVVVRPKEVLELDGYRLLPLPVKHSVPTLAYEISSSAGGAVLYTGDNGPGSVRAWAASSAGVIITEVTFPDADGIDAAKFGHLSPRLLAEELAMYRKLRGYLPRVVVVHVNPYTESQVASELRIVAADLQAEIAIAREGETLTVN